MVVRLSSIVFLALIFVCLFANALAEKRKLKKGSKKSQKTKPSAIGPACGACLGKYCVSLPKQVFDYEEFIPASFSGADRESMVVAILPYNKPREASNVLLHLKTCGSQSCGKVFPQGTVTFGIDGESSDDANFPLPPGRYVLVLASSRHYIGSLRSEFLEFGVCKGINDVECGTVTNECPYLPSERDVPCTCKAWADLQCLRDNNWINLVNNNLPCPCSERDAHANPRLEIGFWDEVLETIEEFHPGANVCYRGEVNGYGQQCCYGGSTFECDDANPCQLLTDGLGAGTLDKAAGTPTNVLIHGDLDVKPFNMCLAQNQIDLYYKFRPISNSNIPKCSYYKGHPHRLCSNGQKNCISVEKTTFRPSETIPIAYKHEFGRPFKIVIVRKGDRPSAQNLIFSTNLIDVLETGIVYFQRRRAIGEYDIYMTTQTGYRVVTGYLTVKIDGTTSAPFTTPPTFRPGPSPVGPSRFPTRPPTQQPTASSEITRLPTSPIVATGLPTRLPTFLPTTESITPEPAQLPSRKPTQDPTPSPTSKPTPQPIRDPTHSPTSKPTSQPTELATLTPTADPRAKTADPTSIPSTSNSMTNFPTVTPPTVTPGWWSGVFGDPHLSTFDRLRFDCQAEGEFTMITSLETPAFKIQERFTSVGSGICSQASVSTAVAISEVDIPTVQLSIPRLIGENPETVETTMLNNCPVDLFVDSIQLIHWTASDAQNLYDIGIDIAVAGSVITVKNTMTGVRSDITVSNSAAFGCFFTIQHFLPRNYRPSDTLVGLLGTPNDNRGDDWVSPEGTSYNPPANEAESIFSSSYQYCVENWCVRDESDSIFQYKSDDGESFETMFGCDKAYDEEIEVAVERAAVDRLDLIEVCGNAIFCIVEGICGGIEEAAQVLMDEAILSANQEEVNPLPSTAPSASLLPSESLVPSKMPSHFPTMSPTPFPTLDNCDQNAVITCISVIDESLDSQNPDVLRARWEDFRKAYPERPFCLLQPEPNPISNLYVPQAFFNDSRTLYEQVSRDRGSVASRTDWFEVCNLENLRKQGIVDVAIFVDNSGSLTTSQVQASYNFLLSRMEEEGLNLVVGVSNTLEDWISPFLTGFGLDDELSPCPVECEEGFDDCDGDVENGCETDLFASVNGCGSCGVVCDDQESCIQGICVTNPSNATKCSVFDPAGNPYGIYSGVADQSNSGSYPVTITYNVSGVYTVYPTLSCGNILPIQPTLQEGELSWIEKIEFGGSRCINNGAVTLTVSGEAVWDYVWRGGSILVAGQLSLECAQGNKYLSTTTPNVSPTQEACPIVPSGGCNVCGDEGCVRKPDVTLNYEGLTGTCGLAEQLGLQGGSVCDYLDHQFLPVEVLDEARSACGCA